jgi:hypothetical protein
MGNLHLKTMQDYQEYFEINNSGNLVRLEPVGLIKYNSDLDWDKNWVKTNVTIKGGMFSGQYEADFMTVDFERFKQELSPLYNNLKGTASFNDLEGYLKLKIILLIEHLLTCKKLIICY